MMKSSVNKEIQAKTSALVLRAFHLNGGNFLFHRILAKDQAEHCTRGNKQNIRIYDIYHLLYLTNSR